MMYCLRSFLLLVFLPFPIAPPLFSFLFLTAFYIQKRPCIYCTLLLIGIFFSTSHWDLAPHGSIAAESGDAIRRCWADLNGGRLLQMRSFGHAANLTSISQTSNASAELDGAADLRLLQWLGHAVAAVSSGVTEKAFGFRLTL